MNSSVKDFVREKICFYSPILGANNFKSLIGLAKEHGVRGVEFLNYGEMTTPDMAAARELGRLAREGGLLIPCFSVGLNLVGEDRKEKIASVKKYAEICSELEIPYLHHTVAFKLSKPYDVAGMGRNFELGVEATQEIAEYANRLGVKTVLEDQAFIVNGVQGYSRFREAAKNCFDVLLDTGNIYFVDETAGAFAEAFADSIVHTHVKEYYYTETKPEREPCYLTWGDKYLSNAIAGEGDVDYGRVKAALKKANYKGVYSMEYSIKSEEDLHRTFEYLASVFADL